MRYWIFIIFSAATLLAACSSHVEEAAGEETAVLTLPTFAAADLNSGKLGVVATTSIIGDVAAQVGGETIDLTVLMGPGQDPHSYQPGAQDLTAVATAHVIFINGWDLEEALVSDLQNIGNSAVVVPISAGIVTLEFGAHDTAATGDAHEHGQADPHVWFSIPNVEQWVDNVAQTLSALDPANTAVYAENAAVYQAKLANLATDTETKLAVIPADKRLLVTNHDSFSYFARDYDFELVGTVIPAASTLAEPSANDLTQLIDHMEASHVCTIFTETTVSDSVARTIAAELAGCATVQVLPLYTGAVGPTGSGADSYIGMFQANVNTIVQGLTDDENQ